MPARFEEAVRCPECGFPGVFVKKHSGEQGSTIYSYSCRSPRCESYKAGWFFQVLNNGEIPLATNRKERYDK